MDFLHRPVELPLFLTGKRKLHNLRDPPRPKTRRYTDTDRPVSIFTIQYDGTRQHLSAVGRNCCYDTRCTPEVHPLVRPLCSA